MSKETKKKSKEISCLLVLPGPDTETSVVKLDPSDWKTVAQVLKCEYVEEWPEFYMCEYIYTPKKKYKVHILVNEEPAKGSKTQNLCASLTAHPLAEANGQIIFGPALVYSSESDLDLSDWKQIGKGTWYNEKWVQKTLNSGLRGSRK